MSNTLGKLFAITSFGESHGQLVGVIIDGCPAGLAVDEADIQKELDRRKPGTSSLVTPRQEEDKVQVLAGIFGGRTTGAPICLAVGNQDADFSAYEKARQLLRPGQADYTAYVKYGGYNDYRGGGRFSGRITAGFVMAGAVARKLLATIGVEVLAHTIEIGGIQAVPQEPDEVKNMAANAVHCTDTAAAEQMIAAVAAARKEGDSLGGVIEGLALGLPVGLGEPAFDAIDAELAKALFAIPAVKGVEFGAGFAAARLKGSQNNDPFTIENGKIVTTTNNAGGVLGGISNGMPLVVRVAIKPTASIAREQRTVDIASMQETGLTIKGRHDACIVPRAVVVVESMIAVVLCDLAMRAGLIAEVIR
jgi:chorismate synthase